jgi:23S rRNA pseudouridine1911/1915/1917 synthase
VAVAVAARREGRDFLSTDHAPALRLVVPEAAAGRRADHWLAETVSGLSRSRIQALMRAGDIRTEDGAIDPAARLRANAVLIVAVPAPVPSGVAPEAIPLDIVFEDEDLIVLNKLPGIVVHPGAGAREGTLAAALLHHCGALSTIGGVHRPGVVHRLDRGTSGLMVVARNDDAHRDLSRQFKERSVTKEYQALVLGHPRRERGSLTGAVGRDPKNRKRMAVVEGGREARSDYAVVERVPGAAVLRVRIFTGRTHQIRVHLSHAGHPVAGDELYGGVTRGRRAEPGVRQVLARLVRPALHSRRLGFIHPRSSRPMAFER